MNLTERYTAYPRPVLWLVPEGETVAPFYMSTLPVTNRQLEACTGERERSAAAPGDDEPALVGFDLASAYCTWYAAVSRKAIRLPSDAEWEHACRAGGGGRWFWGEDEAAAEAWVWHGGNCDGSRVPPLGAKRSNGFGLHAMLGGVWEWVVGEDGALLCGGSWRTPLAEQGCGRRRLPAAGEVVEDAGFRIARSLRG